MDMESLFCPFWPLHLKIFCCNWTLMLSKSLCRSLFSTPYMPFVGLAFNQIGFLYPSKLFSALYMPLDGHIFYCNCLVYIYKSKVFSSPLLASTLIEFAFLMHQSSFCPLYVFSGPLSLLTLFHMGSFG